MNLESDLRSALRRESPPEGFAARVLRRVEEDEARKRRNPWWRAVAASLTLSAILGAWGAHEIQQRREGERAKEQVLLALRIAGEKVRIAQSEVRTIGSHD